MQLDSVTQVISAVSPIALALLTGFFTVRSNRQRRSSVVLARLRSEMEVAESMPNSAEAKSVIEDQLHATALRYREICAHEDTLKRDTASMALGAVFGLGGIWLGTWAALNGGAYFWFWLLAIPLVVLGVVGFFYELAGGKSRQAATSTVAAESAAG
ncbi:hypothetical protein ACFV6F_09775 [Kitasatospora phosalacinea]|uniref:hypothetical protein n=1 Tax=Kitasatospora phosalacinea TaxID=2065 RepID=UPI00365A3235